MVESLDSDGGMAPLRKIGQWQAAEGLTSLKSFSRIRKGP